jgi:hypothetical protein
VNKLRGIKPFRRHEPTETHADPPRWAALRFRQGAAAISGRTASLATKRGASPPTSPSCRSQHRSQLVPRGTRPVQMRPPWTHGNERTGAGTGAVKQGAVKFVGWLGHAILFLPIADVGCARLRIHTLVGGLQSPNGSVDKFLAHPPAA